jgi:dolichol-phosphate mannosyltransferase
MPDNPRLIPREGPDLLSIVIPMYNEEEVLPLLRAELERVRGDLDGTTELVLVDDGSKDRTFLLAREWSLEDDTVKVIRLSRNFGHQVAVSAGLQYAEGDAIVILDADLQDPPDLIPQMVDGYREGYDVVYGQRLEREGESWFKRTTAALFYRFMEAFVDSRLPRNVGDFRLISRRVNEAVSAMPEQERFLRGLVAWVGFEQKALPYRRPVRQAGRTKYPLWKMLRFAVHAVVSFSTMPLRLILWFGFAAVLVSFLIIARTLYLYYTDVDLVPGWASISIFVCFFSGAILISLGTIGLYVGRIYNEVLRRPLFLVGATLNVDRKEPSRV